MTFPELERITLRTDGSFRNRRHRKHHLGEIFSYRLSNASMLNMIALDHTGTSPFEELDMDMINSFPLDYMHLVLLGVFKRLIQIWTGTWNKKWRSNKLGQRERTEIDRRLRYIRFSYPTEFHRIPLALNGGNLKATELRSILLYTGPAVFKGILSREQYDHFLYLHIGIRILASETQVYNTILTLLNCVQRAHSFSNIVLILFQH